MSETQRPWRFEAQLMAEAPPEIPSGDLARLTKRRLQLILAGWGYQTRSLAPLKAEYVAALEWLRCSRANNGGGE